MRIDKFLADSGIGSRKNIKELIKKGAVTIGGMVVKDSGMHVEPDSSDIIVNNELISYKKYIYIMMNKPGGYISATYDKRFPVVTQLLDEYSLSFEPFPAGRLDIDTEGMLLLTNDGELCHRILSPKNHIKKTYLVISDLPVDDSDISAFAGGVTLDDGYRTMGADLIADKNDIYKSFVTLYEGKYHQVKRMFNAVGKEVVYLKRISMGNLRLDKALKKGEYREITPNELKQLCEE